MVKDNDIQLKIDTSMELLKKAKACYEASAYKESEQLSKEALELLEPYANRTDLGEPTDSSSQIHDIIQRIALAYNRLNTISSARGDTKEALEYARTGIYWSEKVGNEIRKAALIDNIGNIYWKLSDYSRALEYFQKSLALNEKLSFKSGIAHALCHIGGVFYKLSEYSVALEYYHKSLTLSEELDLKFLVALNLGNIGMLHANLKDFPQAFEYILKALAINEEIGAKGLIAGSFNNLGGMYCELSEYSLALEYYYRALAISEEIGIKEATATTTCCIGAVYANLKFEGYNPVKAEELFMKASEINAELGTKQNLYFNYKCLAELYEQQERWKESQQYFKKHFELKNEVQSEETKKLAEQFDFERKQADHEKQLAVERAKHEATEQLLHNVLPPEIASRMLSGEQLIAEKLENVSILFADMVDFTKLSQRISAEELVTGLDGIFSEFDTLAEKYGLEKIKTIGDAYMVVAGAPKARTDHAEVMAQMATEMLDVMNDFKAFSTGEAVQIRIGIHSGEAVAGVIGKKKFAYDLWGDAVNTASRMESNGEPGRIHISGDFKNAVGKGFDFIERGEMEVKGKGMMRTYFLEQLR